MSEWNTYQLGELIDLKSGKSRPKEFGEYPVYGGNGILDYTSQFNVSDETIIIGRVGAYCGSVYFENKKIWISDNALFAKAKNGNSPKFLYYYLKDKNLNRFAGGSSHPLLTQGQLNEIEVEVPSEKTQQRIASILSCLDDAIELNQQINKTLEEMAKVIFKEWFVDFNFPNATGKFQETEIGKIPVGWKVEKLGDVCETKGGTTPRTTKKEYWDGEYYWTSPRDLSNLQTNVLLDTSKKITALGLKQISSGILPKGTLLLSSRAPIGYLAISEVPISINQGFIAINGTKVSNLFMLYWLKENMQTIINNANGSTFLEISKTVFRNIPITVPSSEVLDKFEEIVSGIYNQILNNEKENQSLSNLRDTLLPKLMKGEIEIRENETI